MSSYGFKVTQQVKRKEKRGSTVLRIIMIILAVLFLFMGIIFSRGFLFICFLMAGLYFFYDANSAKEYEYILEGSSFQIDEIRGHRYRKIVHSLDLNDLEILAPHDNSVVSKYKKGGKEKIKKFDYTSYDDNTPYYTMIITEDGRKIKLLLDINRELFDYISLKCQQKAIK